MITKTAEEIREAIDAQKALCDSRSLPHFAPYDGMCFDCMKNIYQNYNREGWDGKSHVTGCPHCNYSYCE